MRTERFVVAECHGNLGPAVGSSKGGISVAVLDSANCFHIVRSWRSESKGGTRREAKMAAVRDAAHELAERLNAGGSP